MDDLKPRLRLAAAAIGDAQLTLVLGAGCSRAAPTGLPTSEELSLALFASLVESGLIEAGDVDNPRDLSAVADAAWIRSGNQRDLFLAMDPARFRNATPNSGYRCAVALMLEGVIGTIVTLNFDLALSNSLANMNVGGEIAVLKAPEESGLAKPRTIVYLHRNVECDPDELVLRTIQLTEHWRGQWEQIAALGAVAAPVSVFVGLGTPTPVLSASVERVRGTLMNADVFLVGRRARESNEFARSLGIDDDHYVRLDWNAFMIQLVAHTMRKQREMLVEAVGRLAADNAISLPDIDATVRRLEASGIEATGLARGRWLYQRLEYVPMRVRTDIDLVADLLAAVALLEERSGSVASLRPHGVLEFRSGPQVRGRLAIASGRGSRTVEAVATLLRQSFVEELSAETMPSVFLIGGAVSTAIPPTPPPDIVEAVDSDDITSIGAAPVLVTVAEMREDPSRFLAAWSAA